MSPSPWLARVRSSRPTRLLALPLVLVCGAFGIAGCGSAPEAARTEALPVPASSTDTPCPITGSDMADALRSARTVLLRSENGVCAYGVPSATGRAALTDPIARVVGDNRSVEALRKEAENVDPMLVQDRTDLGPGAFSRTQDLLRGRVRATIVFPRSAGVWTVAVDMPAGQYARNDAMDRAEGLANLLLSSR